MNPAILMLLMSNNGRGLSSIDEPDHNFYDDLSSGEMDWFLWGVVIILGLALAFGAYTIFKR